MKSSRLWIERRPCLRARIVLHCRRRVAECDEISICSPSNAPSKCNRIQVRSRVVTRAQCSRIGRNLDRTRLRDRSGHRHSARCKRSRADCSRIHSGFPRHIHPHLGRNAVERTWIQYICAGERDRRSIRRWCDIPDTVHARLEVLLLASVKEPVWNCFVLDACGIDDGENRSAVTRQGPLHSRGHSSRCLIHSYCSDDRRAARSSRAVDRCSWR